MRGAVAYPSEIRLFAKGYYLQGNSFNEVARLVKQQYPTARCNAETIRRWAMKENWDEPRLAIQTAVDARQRSTVEEVLENHKELYQLMIEKGERGLRSSENVPRTVSEAGSLLDSGIKGQRSTMRDLVSLNFVKTVLQIVVDEVPDEATRRRIATRFRELAESGAITQGGEW